MWCNLVNAVGDSKSGTVRASISLPAEQYSVLEKLAEEKKVSIAWVVRDAVDLYLKEKWPLLAPSRE